MLELIQIFISLLSPLLFFIFPLLSFIILIFFGKKLKEKSSHVALSLIGLMFLNSLFLLSTNNDGITWLEFDWLSTGKFNITLGCYMDNITVIMLFVVSLISLLVHIYSTEYMKGDPKYSRYFAFLGVFTFSMNGIVLADSLIMMYIFWELVGLS